MLLNRKSLSLKNREVHKPQLSSQAFMILCRGCYAIKSLDFFVQMFKYFRHQLQIISRSDFRLDFHIHNNPNIGDYSIIASPPLVLNQRQ